MNIIAKLFASTMPSIENMKSERLPKKRGLALVVLHVAERVDVDERADAGDDEQHDLAQARRSATPIGDARSAGAEIEPRNFAATVVGPRREDEDAGEQRRRPTQPTESVALQRRASCAWNSRISDGRRPAERAG